LLQQFSCSLYFLLDYYWIRG